jgi:hypothetical protein
LLTSEIPITPPETICSNKSHLHITLTQIRANDADSLGSFRYKQATPRLSVVTNITKLTSKRYNVYRKQVGKPIRKSTCRSHEDAIKKQEEFRVLDEDEDKEDGLDQPTSLSTKRVGNYVAGPGRGIKTRVTTANSSLIQHGDKVFLQEIGAFINEKTKELSTSENVPTDISIQSQVLSKVIAAAKHNQDATMSLLLSKAGIFVFFFCAQNRSQNSLRRSRGRENSFLLNCVLHV